MEDTIKDVTKELKEKTWWYYIGDKTENSFEFFVSKINDKDVIIVTNKGTEDMNVHKTSLQEMQKEYNRKKIVKIRG